MVGAGGHFHYHLTDIFRFQVAVEFLLGQELILGFFFVKAGNGFVLGR